MGRTDPRTRKSSTAVFVTLYPIPIADKVVDGFSVWIVRSPSLMEPLSIVCRLLSSSRLLTSKLVENGWVPIVGNEVLVPWIVGRRVLLVVV